MSSAPALRTHFKAKPGKPDNFEFLHARFHPRLYRWHPRLDSSPGRAGDDDLAVSRRHRHHEHHAGQRHRTHARDRRAQGHRREESDIMLQFLTESILTSEAPAACWGSASVTSSLTSPLTSWARRWSSRYLMSFSRSSMSPGAVGIFPAGIRRGEHALGDPVEALRAE